MEQAVNQCISLIEETFSKDSISNTDRYTLKALIICIYDTLCDARAEDMDWWERDEQAEQDKRNKMFGN